MRVEKKSGIAVVFLECISVECRLTKSKVTTVANQKKGRYHEEPMRTRV